jgi:sugar phosphate isomerase/epimerase
MNLKLAIGDYSFPKLEWEQTLRLARDIGMQGMDVALFAGRSHLDSDEVLSDPSKAAARVSAALRSNDLEIADVFGQAGRAFEENALNHPDVADRKRATEFFYRILEFAVRCNSRHLTLLPGTHFQEESYEDSLKRSAEQLAWRIEAARRLGVTFSIEPHVGSIVATPPLAKRLLEMAPGLTLTLDYTHFTCQGIVDDEIEPLLAFASHFHARGACRGKLQASMKEDTIDYDRVLQALNNINYPGFIVLEYVWTEWMRCNEVDNITETIVLRDLLRAQQQQFWPSDC